MKYLNEHLSVKEVKAETLLALWNINEDFHVRMESIFARNYAEDLISVDYEEDKLLVTLARDSLFHLLPEGLFFEENRLRDQSKRGFNFTDEYTELKKQKKEITSFFQPIDTELFKINLAFEHKLNDFFRKGNDSLCHTFLDDNRNETQNKYIAEINKMLPFTSQIRGNLPLLIDILKNVLSVEKINVEKITLFHFRFIIHKEGLSKDEYIAMDNDLEQFFDYFKHWFLPVEQKYDYRIKDFQQPFTLGAELILDYNTHL